MSQTYNDPKEGLAKEYRKHVLVYRITGSVYRTLPSIFRKSPQHLGKVPHEFVALVSLIFTMIAESLILLVGGTAALQEALFVVIALGMVFFLTLRQAEMVGRRVIDTLLAKMSPPIHDQQIWDAISKNVKGQGSIAAVAALGCIPFEIVILRQILTHTSAIWPIVVFASVGVWVLSSSAYMGIVSSRKFVDLLKPSALNLYPLDPARSPILQPIVGLFAGVMFDQAILGVAIVMSFFVVKPTALTATIGTAILVFVVFMLIGNFVYAQLKLAALISQTKRKTISELQEKIRKIYEDRPKDSQAAAGKPDEDKELSKLLNLYEKVVKSSSFAIDVESLSTYLSGLVWPLVSILTVNLPVPRHVIDNISQLLGEFSQFLVQFIDSGF